VASDAARDAIFAALRVATAALPRSALRAAPAPYAGPLGLSASAATFAASLEAAGGRLVRCAARALAEACARIDGFAGARHVWSSVPELAPRGVACALPTPHALAVLDFAVLRGQLAVAENGAVWHVPRSPLERAAALLAEHLVLVVPEAALVASLHDAYARIGVGEPAFGWFLAGPSKTADIEQALVLGAHGPCAATVVLTS
jgi:L-lactate dehydrogenase complex protein LldG